jgi:hypothetical protein
MKNVTKDWCVVLGYVTVSVAVGFIAISFLIKPAPAEPTIISSITPTPSASAPTPLVLTPPPEFDMKKRDQQWDWCCAHHGVPTMTFTINGSNVLCLKPEVVIAPPLENACR